MENVPVATYQMALPAASYMNKPAKAELPWASKAIPVPPALSSQYQPLPAKLAPGVVFHARRSVEDLSPVKLAVASALVVRSLRLGSDVNVLDRAYRVNTYLWALVDGGQGPP